MDFIQSAFYFLLSDKDGFEGKLELLYDEAVYWQETCKILETARLRLNAIGPVFDLLKDLPPFTETFPREGKATTYHRNGWDRCSEAASSLRTVSGAIRNAGLEKPNSRLPIKANFATKLRTIRRGQPRDPRFDVTLKLWAGALEKTFGKPQNKFLSELFFALGREFTSDAIAHRLDSL